MFYFPERSARLRRCGCRKRWPEVDRIVGSRSSSITRKKKLGFVAFRVIGWNFERGFDISIVFAESDAIVVAKYAFVRTSTGVGMGSDGGGRFGSVAETGGRTVSNEWVDLVWLWICNSGLLRNVVFQVRKFEVKRAKRIWWWKMIAIKTKRMRLIWWSNGKTELSSLRGASRNFQDGWFTNYWPWRMRIKKFRITFSRLRLNLMECCCVLIVTCRLIKIIWTIVD